MRTAVAFLSVEGSHALEPFMDEIAKQVIDPETNVTVFERARAHEAISARSAEAKKKIWDEKELKLEAMGSGSDYSSFIQHEGIPSLNLGYGGEDHGGEYHSIYDSYSLFLKFKDPGFQYGVVLWLKLQGMQFYECPMQMNCLSISAILLKPLMSIQKN